MTTAVKVVTRLLSSAALSCWLWPQNQLLRARNTCATEALTESVAGVLKYSSRNSSTAIWLASWELRLLLTPSAMAMAAPLCWRRFSLSGRRAAKAS